MFIDTEAANKAATRVTVTSSSPRNASRYSPETTPLMETFVGQAPPPSYLEATTPAPWNNRPSGDEAARLLSFDVRDDLDEEGLKRGGHRGDSWRESCTTIRMLKWLVVIIIIILLSAIWVALSQRNSIAMKPGKPELAEPVQSGRPVVPVPVPVPSKPKKDEYPIRWPVRCGKNYNTKIEEYNFGTPTDFNLQEAVHQMEKGIKRVSGWIHVTRAPDDQAVGTISARLAYAASSSVNIDNIKYVWTDNGLIIGDATTPDTFDRVGKTGRACLGMSVVIYMAPNTTLENLSVNSVHLGMQVHDGVRFSVTNATSITLTTGTLDSSSFSSRETRLETISGSISGKYNLQDLLQVTTKSGSVNINVEPKANTEGNSAPAIFRANSLSGSIRTDFERKKIPERDYQTYIETGVGSVDGTYIHGSKTQITSVAGFITADVLPFKTGAYESQLDTSSTSGQTSLRLRSPYQKAGVALEKLMSTHKGVSGALDITYPQEWEGHLDGSSLNGVVHLQGRDLELLHEEQDITGGNRVEAKKGKGNSRMSFGTISGGCEVKVGKI
ncbi:hypothetical protein B0J11DRAFT_501926 [Dendryphion nanum]|uniref:Adhesin domain-containing protein n=1 Tax=Dendryphion nanum TaxID=256645 RepID=A0A9P9IWQ7_9PLEO|nr:hypothetical protein B0J11DRAFT_501926 [Dendryphion nanum]